MPDFPSELFLPSGEAFARGAARYFDHHPDLSEPLSRIYVKFIPEGTDLQFIALLDTGGHYCILDRSVVREIEPRLTEKIGATELRTARGPLRGDLFLHRITLVAEAGTPLDIEALVLALPDWEGPSFIGYTGVLDRISFAVQPRDNLFLFGPTAD